MTDRPILFSAPMVLRLLDGSKTQTRRTIGLAEMQRSETPGYDWTWRGQAPIRSIAQQRKHPHGCWQDVSNDRLLALCPYYQVPGDRLYVRETWRASSWEGDESAVPCADIDYCADGTTRHVPIGGDADIWRDKQNAYALAHGGKEVDGCIIRVDADGMMDESPWPWRPSIFMPRWASRLSLTVTSVRVERVQEISEADARAEGVTDDGLGGTAREMYARLWESINGAGSWAKGPWVWVIGFEKGGAT